MNVARKSEGAEKRSVIAERRIGYVPRIVVEMCFDVAGDNPTKCLEKLIHLYGTGSSDGICNAYSVNTNLIHSRVNPKAQPVRFG